ncbi:MAG: hypothetical protein L0Z53_25160 [Acidobacteriales bacterium]|nr:hypothetical protein [Terriglobales bacterium]
MKRPASILLMVILVCLTVSPLAASRGQSHPAACPRVANHNHCHNAESVEGEHAVTAQSPDCPMRCCPTVRSSAVDIPFERTELASFNSAALEPRAHERAALVAVAQTHLQRGPPLPDSWFGIHASA